MGSLLSGMSSGLESGLTGMGNTITNGINSGINGIENLFGNKTDMGNAMPWLGKNGTADLGNAMPWLGNGAKGSMLGGLGNLLQNMPSSGVLGALASGMDNNTQKPNQNNGRDEIIQQLMKLIRDSQKTGTDLGNSMPWLNQSK